MSSMLFVHKIPTSEEKAKDIKRYEKSLKKSGYEECIEEQEIKLIGGKLFLKKIHKNYSSIGLIVEVHNQITVITINDNEYKMPK